MTFLKQALDELGISKDYSTLVKYTQQFNDYGANIRVYNGTVTLKLSATWRQISDEIKIGLAQDLLVRVFKLKKHTINMDLYNGFVKKLHIAVKKEVPEKQLLDSFNRVNEKYFFGMMDIPNIIWGDFAIRKLGSYDYRQDRITLSKVLEKDSRFLDLVMHHELLHKKHKYSSKSGRSLHHSAAFKAEEKKFENFEETEKALKQYLMKHNLRKLFRLW